MGDEQIQGLLTRLLGKLGINRDVAAEENLDRRTKIADDRTRANRQSTYQPEMPDDAIPFKIISCNDDHGIPFWTEPRRPPT